MLITVFATVVLLFLVYLYGYIRFARYVEAQHSDDLIMWRDKELEELEKPADVKGKDKGKDKGQAKGHGKGVNELK